MPPICIVAWRPPVLSKAHLFEIVYVHPTNLTPLGGDKVSLRGIYYFLLTVHQLMSIWLISPAWLSEGVMNVLD